MYQYDMIARSLSKGSGYRWYSSSDVQVLEPYYSKIVDLSKIKFPENGFLTTFRAPGYPVFLAGLYSLVPSSSRFILARLVQASLLALLTPAAALASPFIRSCCSIRLVWRRRICSSRWFRFP
jgi:hypothetical protein